MLSTSVLESKSSNLIIDMTAPLEHPTKSGIWDEDATIFRDCDQTMICIRNESFMRFPTMDYINIRASVPFISSSGQWSHILFRKQNFHASPHDNNTLYSLTLPYSKKGFHVLSQGPAWSRMRITCVQLLRRVYFECFNRYWCSYTVPIIIYTLQSERGRVMRYLGTYLFFFTRVHESPHTVWTRLREIV